MNKIRALLAWALAGAMLALFGYGLFWDNAGAVVLLCLIVFALLAWELWPKRSTIPRFDEHGRENLVMYCTDCLQTNITVSNGMHVGCPKRNLYGDVKPISPWVKKGARL